MSGMRALKIVLLLLLLDGTARCAEPVVGLTRERPADVRFVKTDRGYMISYQVKIPRTELTFTMVPIPGGPFRLGSPIDEPGRDGVEGPSTEVTLEPFWIGQHEVTWGEYQIYYDLRLAFRRFRQLGVRQVTSDNRADAVTAPSTIYNPPGRLPADNDERRRAKYPAVSMTQYAAKQYTKWLSKLTDQFYRLPSEAEWEFACRVGSKNRFYFGDDAGQLDEYAWCSANSGESTHPVGLKKPNAWGLYDMHGNAAEWVLDQFDQSGYRQLQASVKAGGPPLLWPTKLHPRTVRGGSWRDDPQQCRSASRLASSARWQEHDAGIPQSPWWLAAAVQRQIGFRFVRPLEPPESHQRVRYWDAAVKELRYAVDVCFEENRGAIGLVDPGLPTAIRRVARE